MNKSQFMDCLYDLVFNDFSYLIIDAKTEDNYLDFVLTGIDLNSFSQNKIDKFSDNINSIEFKNKYIKIYGYVPEIYKEIDDCFVNPFITVELNKNKYNENDLYKYSNIIYKFINKISKIYNKYNR